jgi:hypothetical protein
MVILIFVLQGNAGFDYWDEGFLWYGTIRTAFGDIPLRDFQSYDPGRYYWGALWFKILRNDGIMALRISQAIFQFAGLTLALFLLRRLLQQWLLLIAAATLLLVWMFPPWKIYEPVITIVAVYFAVRTIEKPTKLRHLIAGIFVGMAAFFGRNHGLYCSVAFLGLIVFCWWKNSWRLLIERLAAFSVGVVIGYLPMLAMLVVVPRFFAVVIASIVFQSHYGTNLPLPVPWPWRVPYDLYSRREFLHHFSVGLAYLAFPLCYLAGGIALFLRPKLRDNRVFVASTFVGAVYLHYIFERPHVYYLAWTIPPLIIGLIALATSFSGPHKRKFALTVWSLLILGSITVAEMAPENYFLIKARGLVRARVLRAFHVDIGIDMAPQQANLVRADIRGDTLWVQKEDADLINVVSALNQRLIPTADNVLVAPYWTGFYPILRKESPTWEIYFLFPRPLSEQQEMVADLKRKQVRWALVCNNFLDKRPELSFQSTHSYVWKYLTENFESVPIEPKVLLLKDCELLHRQNTNDGSAQPASVSPTSN